MGGWVVAGHAWCDVAEHGFVVAEMVAEWGCGCGLAPSFVAANDVVDADSVIDGGGVLGRGR